MMKLNTKLLTIAALTFALSSVSFASDLRKDLKTPFDVMTNPFDDVQEIALKPETAEVLKELIQDCTFRIVTKGPKYDSWDVAQLKADCAPRATLKLVRGPLNGFNKLVVHDQGLRLIALSWDGSHSDGGDQQALGIYDQRGVRMAVYPSLFADGNVIDALALALGVDVPQVFKFK
jgi:hypothetical protein